MHFAWNAEGLANLSPEARNGQLAGRTVGLIAQEVEDVAPELVHTDANGFKSVDYGRLTAVLVQAVKEQQSLIRDLNARIVTIEQGA